MIVWAVRTAARTLTYLLTYSLTYPIVLLSAVRFFHASLSIALTTSHCRVHIGVLVHQCVHGPAPFYLKNTICPVASTEPRRCLRSASSADLVVPATRCSTLGDRAFAVAGPRAWNSLPDAIRHNSSLAVSKRSLKHTFPHKVFIDCFHHIFTARPHCLQCRALY